LNSFIEGSFLHDNHQCLTTEAFHPRIYRCLNCGTSQLRLILGTNVYETHTFHFSVKIIRSKIWI